MLPGERFGLAKGPSSQTLEFPRKPGRFTPCTKFGPERSVDILGRVQEVAGAPTPFAADERSKVVPSRDDHFIDGSVDFWIALPEYLRPSQVRVLEDGLHAW